MNSPEQGRWHWEKDKKEKDATKQKEDAEWEKAAKTIGMQDMNMRKKSYVLNRIIKVAKPQHAGAEPQKLMFTKDDFDNEERFQKWKTLAEMPRDDGGVKRISTADLVMNIVNAVDKGVEFKDLIEGNSIDDDGNDKWEDGKWKDNDWKKSWKSDWSSGWDNDKWSGGWNDWSYEQASSSSSKDKGKKGKNDKGKKGKGKKGKEIGRASCRERV